MRRSCAEGENISLGAGRCLIGSEFVKVLQINSVYGVGSTGKITQALHTALLADGADSIVLYGRGPDADAPGVYRLCRNLYGRANSLLSRLTGLRYGGCNLATGKAFRILSKEQPDVVVCTGVLAMIPLCMEAKLSGRKLIYIESFAKVTSATLTGKLLYHYADRFYVQWTQMKEIYPDAICLGGIY